MGGLSHMFYKKKVIEMFDENVNLMGFENGVLDLVIICSEKADPRIILL